MAIAGVFLCSVLSSRETQAGLFCIHPVPLTIKELVEKQKSGVISKELLEVNSEYLLLKYCAASDDRISAMSSVTLGDSCEMRSGYRLGELVYWATCKATDPIETQKSKGKEKLNAGKDSMESLVECCLAYCGAIKCNSPPATTACSPSYLTSTLAKYPQAFPNVAAYKKNLYTGARSYNGAIVRACL